MTDILIVCSPGGHFSEARELFDCLECVDYKYVTHMAPVIPETMIKKIIIAPHAERDLRLIKQFIFALNCLRREKPKILISTGAGIGFIFGVAAKIHRIPFIFIESPTRVTSPSLAAILCYRFADVLYVRNKSLLKFFPKARFVESK